MAEAKRQRIAPVPAGFFDGGGGAGGKLVTSKAAVAAAEAARDATLDFLSELQPELAQVDVRQQEQETEDVDDLHLRLDAEQREALLRVAELREKAAEVRAARPVAKPPVVASKPEETADEEEEEEEEEELLHWRARPTKKS